MRKTSVLLLLALLLTACNTTERIIFFPPSDAQTSERPLLSADEYEAQYGVSEGVYLTYDRTLEHNVAIAFTSTIPQWKFFEVVIKRYMVLDPASEKLTHFRLEVPARQSLEQLTLVVSSPGLVGQTYGRESMTREPGPNGSSIYTFTVPNVERGTIIEERYELAYSNLENAPPLLHEVPLQLDLPCEEFGFRYIYPHWWQVQVKALQQDQPLQYERREFPERRKIVLAYEAQNVPAFKPEAFSPYFRETAPYFQLMVTQLTMGSSLRYRAPEDWTAFADQYKHYATGVGLRPSRQVSQTAIDLLRGNTTDTDKLNVILRFVRDEIQVTNESRATSVAGVLDARAGNPFLVTGLAQALLAEDGIESEYLLVHPATQGYFDPNYYSPQQLTVPALNVFADGQQYFVFPGQRGVPTGFIPEPYQGQTAMVITPKGFGGFTDLYTSEAAENNSTWNIVVEFDESGNATANGEVLLGGGGAVAVRQWLHRQPGLEDELFWALLPYAPGSVEGIGLDILNPEVIDEPLRIRIRYSMTPLVHAEGRLLTLQTLGLFTPIQDLVSPDTRQNPVLIRHDQIVGKQVTIRYPEGWTLATELQNAAHENRLGRITTDYQVGTGFVQSSQQLTLLRAREPVESAVLLAELVGAESPAVVSALVFDTSGSGFRVQPVAQRPPTPSETPGQVVAEPAPTQPDPSQPEVTDPETVAPPTQIAEAQTPPVQAQPDTTETQAQPTTPASTPSRQPETPVQSPPVQQPPAQAPPVVGQPIGQPEDATPTTPVNDSQPVESTANTPPPDASLPSAPEWRGTINPAAGGWTWVVASRTELREAEALATEYARLFIRDGVGVGVITGVSEGLTRYRIAVGQYASYDQARAQRGVLGSRLPEDAWLLEMER